MWNIYSIGDGSFLSSILNAVALLTGTGDFAVIVRIGFGLGVLLMAVNGVLQGGRGVPWQQAMVALVLYLVMFGPQARVSVEDVYTGQVYTIDNVPFGVAATGSIMSTVGYSMTSLFETAFATPSMSNQSYGASLKHLQAAREAMLNRINIGEANSPSGRADIEKSWQNYVHECTLTAIDVHANNPAAGKSLDDVLNNPLPDSLRFDSNGYYYTKIYLPSGAQTLTCENAYTVLNGYTDAEFLPAVKRNIKSYLAPNSYKSTDQLLQDALDGIEQYGIGVNTYLKAVYLTPVYQNGVIAKHLDAKQQTMAAIVNEAVQQRNVQWQAQKSVFETIVQPLITFMEAFFYALTPFMGLAIGLGVMGMKMLGKYLVMALWIQLWMPIMAIVNHYMHEATAGKIAALQQTVTSGSMSIAGIQQWDGVIQSQLAVGGMLASSVPVLSLFVISGSYYTLTNIASQMTGADHIDENKAGPSTSDPNKFDSMMQYNPETGLSRTGASGALTSFGWSSSDAASTSSARQEATSASSQFSSMLGQKVSAMSSSSEKGSESMRFGSSTTVGNSESEKMLKSQGQSISDKWSDSSSVSESTISRLGAQAAAGKSQASLSGSIQKQTNLTKTQADELASDLKTGFSQDSSWNAQYQDQVAQEFANGSENIYTRGTSLSDDKQLQESAQESVQASENYQQAVSSGVTGKMDQSVEGLLAGKQLAGDKQAFSQLSGAIQQAGLKGAVDRYMQSRSGQEDVRRFGGNEDAAEAYAMLLTANGQNDYQREALSPIESGTVKDAANSALAGTFGQQGGPQIGNGASRNAGISNGQVPVSGSVQREVQSQVDASAVPSAATVAANSQAGLEANQAASAGIGNTGMREGYRGRVSTARSASEGAFDDFMTNVQSKVEGQMKESNDQSMQTAMTAQSGTGLTAAGGNLGRIASAAVDSVRDGSSFMDNYRQGWESEYQQNYDYAQGNGLTDNQSAYYAHAAMSAGIDQRAAEAAGIGNQALAASRETYGQQLEPEVRESLWKAAMEGEGNNQQRMDMVSNLNDPSQGNFNGLYSSTDAISRPGPSYTPPASVIPASSQYDAQSFDSASTSSVAPSPTQPVKSNADIPPHSRIPS